MFRNEDLENAKNALLRATAPITLTIPHTSWNTFKRKIKKVPSLILRPGTVVHLTDNDFFLETYIFGEDNRWYMLEDLASF